MSRVEQECENPPGPASIAAGAPRPSSAHPYDHACHERRARTKFSPAKWEPASTQKGSEIRSIVLLARSLPRARLYAHLAGCFSRCSPARRESKSVSRRHARLEVAPSRTHPAGVQKYAAAVLSWLMFRREEPQHMHRCSFCVPRCVRFVCERPLQNIDARVKIATGANIRVETVGDFRSLNDRRKRL